MDHQIHGIIFDFDGTLADSMGLWHAIDVEYLKRRNINCPEDLPFSISGMSIEETAHYFKKRFNLTETIDEIFKEWDDMSYNVIQSEINLKPGALEFLNWLSQIEVPMSIASSNSRKNITAFLPRFHLESHFHSLHFTGELGKGKPDPLVFLDASKALGIPPENCLVFEDTLEGVKGALAAGMPVYSVEDSYQMKRIESIKELSIRHIKDFRELINDPFSRQLLQQEF